MVKVVTTITVNDFEQWKKSFDSGTTARQAAGWQGTKIYRGEQNPNEVTLIHEWADTEKYKVFMSNNPILLEILKKSHILTPINNSVTWVKVMTALTVPNFEKWKPEFEAGAASRQASGCQETIVYCSEQDLNELILVQTWESTEKIKTFLNNPVYSEARRKAGVSELQYYVLTNVND